MSKMLYRVGEVEMQYKRYVPFEQQVQISCSNDIYEKCKCLFDMSKIDYTEFFFVMCLNKSGMITDFSVVFEGSIDGCIVDVKKIMQLALLTNSTNIVIGHNHPSGKVRPSVNDKDTTKKVKDACRIMDIRLLDHIIIANGDYYSFADNKEM